MKQEGLLEDVIFYHIEHAIKAYRQFAQARLRKKGFKITIDQWLLLKTLADHPGTQQNKLAEIVFKEEASVTRIVSLLAAQNLLKREKHENRRRSNLVITPKGYSLLKAISPVITVNREKALQGLKKKSVKDAEKVLKRIASNCA